MSKFVVDLTESEQNSSLNKSQTAIVSGNIDKGKPSTFKKVLKIFLVLIVVFGAIGAIGGFFYWQNLKRTPEYSLALLVDAARNDDQEKVDQFVNADAVVDDFLPQITGKAIELYGRGMAPEKIKQVSTVILPILPAVKDRARAELPKLIREKTKAFEKFPFWAIAIGASQYFDIKIEGDNAFIKSNLRERELELTLKRNGDKWQIIAVKDEALAQRIAEKVGQEIIGLAQSDGANSLRDAGKKLGIENAKDLLKQAEAIFK